MPSMSVRYGMDPCGTVLGVAASGATASAVDVSVVDTGAIISIGPLLREAFGDVDSEGAESSRVGPCPVSTVKAFVGVCTSR